MVECNPFPTDCNQVMHLQIHQEHLHMGPCNSDLQSDVADYRPPRARRLFGRDLPRQLHFRHTGRYRGAFRAYAYVLVLLDDCTERSPVEMMCYMRTAKPFGLTCRAPYGHVTPGRVRSISSRTCRVAAKAAKKPPFGPKELPNPYMHER